MNPGMRVDYREQHRGKTAHKKTDFSVTVHYLMSGSVYSSHAVCVFRAPGGKITI